MEVKNYAPVIIPTLNRYEHFKRCLESLERCTGAEYTEVYVALDFPPSDKYRKGWEQIDTYLAEKVKKNAFKHLNVVKRDRNYGVGHQNSNSMTLVRDVRQTTETYIFSEDDNEFSPCFLEYVNICLNRFMDDDRIIKVCGYNFEVTLPEMYRNNFYLSKRGCAWGTGSWTRKQVEQEKYNDLEYLRKIIQNNESYSLLKERYPRGISLIHSMLKLKKIHGDATWEIYCALEDKYMILPTVSKVRNHGNDGTGVHSLKIDESQNKFYAEQPIDNSYKFEFTNDIFTYEPVYMHNKNYKTPTSLRTIYKSLVCKLDIWLLRKFNFMPKSKYI